MNIREAYEKFGTDEQCLQYIEKMRWPDGIVRCPTCGQKNVEKYERPEPNPKKRRSLDRKPKKENKRNWVYICREADCRQQFSPTAGTIFHDTHLPLIVWFQAIALILNAKKGISAKQLQRDLGIGGYKTAWYLNHRIREAMAQGFIPKLGGVVEIDETYVGGKQKGKGQGFGLRQKEIVMGAVQRGGELRLRHIKKLNSDTLREFINEHVGTDAERVMTDEHRAYPAALAPEFSMRHYTVNHIKGEYVRGDITTNSIESAFSLFKRGLIGQFHKLSAKHLHRYLAEFEYRFNNRHSNEMFAEVVRRLAGIKPLQFATLTSAPAADETF
jgi:transposase-like protein